MKRYALVALLAGCSSAPETITLSNGATAYQIRCWRLEQCEQYAAQICKRLDYFVHEKIEYRPTVAAPERPQEWVGASSVSDVKSGSAPLSDNDKNPYWRLVVGCSPPPDQIHSRIEIKGNRVEFERSKTAFIAAVCALRDPELRRKEILIARQDYGDFTCAEDK